ncbi:helix-turn-helix domain-containing protein, partial [Amycolatopsis sp.]|uniref:TetR/AcrR family transcriptional regulator n=1 Tax=Amycolatopsis sp. TaxID=37632 RepID=UPI002D80C0C6
MRTDASQNRARILDAARELSAEKGLDVTMRAVARRAGLGVATLYRHFPDRAALVVAAFEHELADCDRLGEAALADADPWRALRGVVDDVVRAQAGNRAFTWAFRGESRDEAEPGAARAMANIAELVRRAQESGDLRADFSLSDLALLVLGLEFEAHDPVTGKRATYDIDTDLYDISRDDQRGFAEEIERDIIEFLDDLRRGAV